MRIGIITINDRLNYGNRLQNYAVQRVIEEIGGKGENIENTILYNDEYFIKKYLKKIISYIYFNLYNKNKENLNVMLKYNRFLEFNDKYIHKSKYKIINNNIPSEVSNKYDYFIIGSDQIWNPSSPYMFA